METLSPFVSTVKDKRIIRKAQAGDSKEITSLVEMSGRQAELLNRPSVSVFDPTPLITSNYRWPFYKGTAIKGRSGTLFGGMSR